MMTKYKTIKPICFFTFYTLPFFKLIKYKVDRYNPKIAQMDVDAPTDTTLSFPFMKFAYSVNRFPCMPPTKNASKKTGFLNFFSTGITNPNIDMELMNKC